MIDPTNENDSNPLGSVTTMDTLRQRIQMVFKKWDDLAIKQQKKAFEYGIFTAIAVPVAVLFLTVQSLAFTDYSYRSVAILLILLELVILMTALYILFTNLDSRSRGWTRHRFRAEILRREEFLLITKVGPYLTKNTMPELEAAVDLRLTVIDNALTNPAEFIHMEDEQGKHWRDTLENMKPGDNLVLEPNYLKEYIEARAEDQQKWFYKRSILLDKKDTRYENITKGVLTIALVVAAMHLAFLITFSKGDRTLVPLIIDISAIILPPIGAAAAALQTFFQHRRLGNSYEFHSHGLVKLILAFRRLQQELIKSGLSQELKSQYIFEFKRLVLRTEELLGNELQQWYFIMRPDRPVIA